MAQKNVLKVFVWVENHFEDTASDHRELKLAKSSLLFPKACLDDIKLHGRPIYLQLPI